MGLHRKCHGIRVSTLRGLFLLRPELGNYLFTQRNSTVELAQVRELSDQSADKGRAMVHVKKEKWKVSQ